MSPLALELFRRLSLFVLALAALLLVVPVAVSEFGLWGPDIPEQIATAERALGVARSYGGGSEDPQFRTAEDHLEKARRLLQQGERWRARQAAKHALQEANRAQRSALSARESARREAAMVAADIDRRMNELEDLYTEIARNSGKGKGENPFLPMMKEARRSGASVLLAIEEGEYRRALTLQADAVTALERARELIQAHQAKLPATP